MIYQRRKEGTTEDWADMALGAFPACMLAGHEYRIKPEPAAPKWPQTTMSYWDLAAAAKTAERQEWSSDQARAIANAAIAHACETGALVPADKVREIEAKARAEGKREGLHPVAVIQAVVNHMRLGSIDADTIQIILLKAAQL